jgi:hypothetical protein
MSEREELARIDAHRDDIARRMREFDDPSWATPRNVALVALAFALVLGVFGYWLAQRPNPPINVYVHFGTPK